MKYCIYCGASQEADGTFCSLCGKQIEKSQKSLKNQQDNVNEQDKEQEDDEEQEDDFPFQGEIEYHDEEEYNIFYGKGFTGNLKRDSSHDTAADTLIDHYKDTPHQTWKKPEDRKKSIVLMASVLSVFLLVIVSIAIIRTQLLESDVARGAPSYDGEKGLYSERGEESLNGNLGDNQVEEEEEAGRYLLFNMVAIDDIISGRTNPRNVSVAVLDLNSSEVFTTANGEVPFIASGFYTPLYLVALGHPSHLQDVANTMMSQMNNHSANEIIRAVGGFSQVNRALSTLGFEQTTFAREFGDIDASERGFENYTTAKEAARMLEQIYEARQYFRKRVNLLQEGITLPNVANIYAHSGRGIGQTYNVFAVIHEVSGNYIVVIMTDNIGMAGATPIISEILNAIHLQMGE